MNRLTTILFVTALVGGGYLLFDPKLYTGYLGGVAATLLMLRYADRAGHIELDMSEVTQS
jgi:hypothetical protein